MRTKLKTLKWYRKANPNKFYISTAKVAGAHRKNLFMNFFCEHKQIFVYAVEISN